MTTETQSDTLHTPVAILGGVLRSVVVPMLRAVTERAFTLVSGNTTAREHLENASAAFENADRQNSQDVSLQAMAHVAVAIASALPDGILNKEFWGAVTSLSGKDTAPLTSLVDSARTGDIEQVAKTLQSVGSARYSGTPMLFSRMIRKFLDGKAGDIVNSIAAPETLSLFQKVMDQGTSLTDLANLGKEENPLRPR